MFLILLHSANIPQIFALVDFLGTKENNKLSWGKDVRQR